MCPAWHRAPFYPTRPRLKDQTLQVSPGPLGRSRPKPLTHSRKPGSRLGCVPIRYPPGLHHRPGGLPTPPLPGPLPSLSLIHTSDGGPHPTWLPPLSATLVPSGQNALRAPPATSPRSPLLSMQNLREAQSSLTPQVASFPLQHWADLI